MAKIQTRIVLVDDHQLFRHSLRALLEREDDLAVVGEAESGKDFLDLHEAGLACDVICIDVDMPKMNGVQATRLIRERCNDARIIGVSERIDWFAVRDMMNAGADGYVCKSATVADLLQAIRDARRGRRHFCRQVTESIMDAVFDNPGSLASAPSLSERQRQVLKLIADGRSSVEIADCLRLSQATVRGYRASVMRELHLHSDAALTKYAISNGIADHGQGMCGARRAGSPTSAHSTAQA